MGARWGYMLNRWHDQGRVAHVLRDDNGPACGARYYASAGAAVEVPATHQCLRCRVIVARDEAKAAERAWAGEDTDARASAFAAADDRRRDAELALVDTIGPARTEEG